MITAKVIADSISDHGIRLTTLELEYPRFILAEFNTHRVFSRNSASSRAIPVKKMIENVLHNPAFFESVGKNQAGMQATEEVDPDLCRAFEIEWNELARIAAKYTERWAGYGIHKQVANRALEPWMHTRTLVTSTEWGNFFELRDHPDAQPEMQTLARRIRGAMANSDPEYIRHDGSWHLPYVETKYAALKNEQWMVRKKKTLDAMIAKGYEASVVASIIDSLKK